MCINFNCCNIVLSEYSNNTRNQEEDGWRKGERKVKRLNLVDGARSQRGI